MPIRLIILATALNFLAGCETGTDIPAVSEQAVEHPELGDVHCRAVARQRADDAWANGYGLQIQNSVFAEAYRGCVAQRAESPELS